MKKVIQYNGATVTVRRGTVRSRLLSSLVYAKLGISQDTSDEDFLFYSYYARWLSQATVDKGTLDVPKPSATAPEKDIQAGLEAFLDADNEFFDTVIAALNEVDADLNDPELSPEVDPND